MSQSPKALRISEMVKKELWAKMHKPKVVRISADQCGSVRISADQNRKVNHPFTIKIVKVQLHKLYEVIPYNLWNLSI